MTRKILSNNTLFPSVLFCQSRYIIPSRLYRDARRLRSHDISHAIIRSAANTGTKKIPVRIQKPRVSVSDEGWTAPSESTHEMEIPGSPGLFQLAWYSYTRIVVPFGHWYFAASDGLWNGAVAAATKAIRAAAKTRISTRMGRDMVISLLVWFESGWHTGLIASPATKSHGYESIWRMASIEMLARMLFVGLVEPKQLPECAVCIVQTPDPYMSVTV